MSATAYSRSNEKKGTPQKKFCGVCHKKGLAESIYTSHFTKSLPGDKGIITCPTILNASCSFCGEKGHWANEKFCRAMRADIKDRSRTHYVSNIPVRTPTVNHSSNNLFANLDADGEDIIPQKITQPRPHLRPHLRPKPVTSIAPLPTPVSGISWASMASRPASLSFKHLEKPISAGFVTLGNGYKNTTGVAKEDTSARNDLALSIVNERMQQMKDAEWDEEEFYEEEFFDDEMYSDDNGNW